MKTHRSFLLVFLAAFILPGVAVGAVQKINAHKVDGLHAVPSTRSADDRAGKLVAANGKGYLPNNIIRKAPDAFRLGGYYAESYQRECQEGSLGGYADVQGDLTSDFQPVSGYVLTQQIGGPPPPPGEQPYESCTSSAPEARRVSEGVYEVRFGTDGGCGHVPLSVTPESDEPLMVSYDAPESCGVESLVATIRIAGADGPRDSSFTVTLLDPLLLPLP